MNMITAIIDMTLSFTEGVKRTIAENDVDLHQPMKPLNEHAFDDKRKKALEYLGSKHLLKGGKWDRRPTILK